MSSLDVDDLLDQANLPLIDVRSPGEYDRGHIPGSLSIPLFDDAERAEIGTLYKNVGRQQAINRGLEFGGKKADQLVQSIARLAADSGFVLHCWRGGMRSRGMAWLCADCGMKPTLLQGGYKAFRQAAHRSFEQPRRVILLAGQTGSGKTRLLHLLRESGQQVIDLEALAEHRGSVFGGIDGRPQPTVEQFENNLFLQWRKLDPNRPVWIEGESQAIGQVNIPQAVWQQMSAAPSIFVDVDRDQRIDFLMEEYGDLPASLLASAIERLKKRLGGARLKAALDAIDRSDRRTFASIALEYYDKSYTKSLNKRRPESVIRLPLADAGDAAAIPTLIALADSGAADYAKAFSEAEISLD